MPREEREQRIRELAYALWEQEGRPDGQAERHWQMAEKEAGTADDAEVVVAMNTDAASAGDRPIAQALPREIAA